MSNIMDKVLSKLGVTIERRGKNSPGPSQQQSSSVKPLPNLPPGVTLQKKTDSSGRISLPKGITVQSNVTKPVQLSSSEEETNPLEDEWQEDEEYAGEEENYVDEYTESEYMSGASKREPNSGGNAKTGSDVLSKLNIPKGVTIAPPKNKVPELDEENYEAWDDDEYDDGDGQNNDAEEHFGFGPKSQVKPQNWPIPFPPMQTADKKNNWGMPLDFSGTSNVLPPQAAKNFPIFPPGVSVQKKNDGTALSNLNIPKGVTIQPQRKISDSGSAVFSHKAEEQKVVDLSNKNAPVQSTIQGYDEFDEDDGYEKHDSSLETSDDMLDGAEDDVIVSEKAVKPVIPPGITFSKHHVSPKPSLPVFPGVNFSRKPAPLEIPRQNVVPQMTAPKPRPVRNVTALPFDPFPPVVPRTKPSPVRAVSPRATRNPAPAPPPTLITDFLEQQMNLGMQNTIPKKPLTPMKVNLTEANQMLEQFSKKTSLKTVRLQRPKQSHLHLPPGISVQPKKSPHTYKFPDKVEDSNEMESRPVLNKLPPGITLEKKKTPVPAQNFPTTSKELHKFEQPNVQLPPGISFQKKNTVDTSVFPAETDENDREFDEEFEGDEEDMDYFEGEGELGVDTGVKNDTEEPSAEGTDADDEPSYENADSVEEPESNQAEEHMDTLPEALPTTELSEEHGEMDSELHEEDEDPQPKSNELEQIDNNEPIDFENLISSNVITGEKPDGDNSSSPHDEEQDSSRPEEDMEMDDKDMMQNIVDMVTKGEIEGEIQEDKDEEEVNVGKRKSDEDLDDVSSPKKVKEKEDEGEEGEDDDDEGEEIDKSKISGSHLRKNIREVMDESKLDEATLAAQRLEAERLKRIQDQQRIIREVQRQIQQSKQSEKNQARYLSLLHGNSQTSILKTSSMPPPAVSSTSKAPSHVMLKMGNGQQTNLNDKMLELLKYPGRSSEQTDTKNLLGMVGSSVTIAPIKKEPVDEEKKKKRGDVVTLSSDSDDDCVVLSDEEIESEPEEDPTNSGMHTNDRYNVPDEQGRVLVNTAHPPEEPDVFLAPQIAKVIKPHQIGGIRFLYDNIIESIKLYNTSAGFGCILAHSMGLGKTLQIVSFSDIFLRHTSAKKILCIMPINTIQNWQAEYNLWTPKEHADPEVRCRQFDIYIVNESLKNVHSRGKVILDWHKNGGVLLMGYELFRLLSLKKPIRSKRKRPDEVEEERNRGLVEDIYAALVKPGPDLVICDEGHRIKNSHATTSQALKQIATRRRVVLTGYPLQNNLLEYWCMVDFVRPVYLGSKSEFSNMFERPIQNGQCIDSTPQDKRLMRYRAHVLHSLLEGFVQRRSHAVLQQALPKKEEYVLMLRFTDFQKKLYDTFMNDVVRTVAVPNPLKAFAVCCKIWNHPDVLFNFMKKQDELIDLDLEEALQPSMMPPRPLMDMGFGGMGGPVVPAIQPSSPWPRRGPGSRGGRVRQPAKRKAGPNNPPVDLPPPQQQPQKQKQPDNPLPSMSNFAVQSSPAAYGNNQSAPETMQPQQNNYYQQQGGQQKQLPFQQQQQNSYTPSSFNNASHNMFTEHDLFPNNQQMYGNNDFPSTFGSETNFFQGQQYQQSNNAQFDGDNNLKAPYFHRNENSMSSGFDYNQSTSDFNQIPGYSGTDFDSGNFDGNGNAALDFPGLPQQQQVMPQQQQQQQGMSQQMDQYWGNNWPCSSSNYSGGSSSDELFSPSKFPAPHGDKDENFGGLGDFGMGGTPTKMEGDEKVKMSGVTPPQQSVPQPGIFHTPTKSDTEEKKEELKLESAKKDDVPYDWAVDLFKNYVTGVISNSSKMEAFFLILNESISRKDRLLLFSQSLLTLDLIEDFLQKRKVPGQEQHWARNRSYFRLDGSTPALEREKLINEFNSNANIHLFLVSTRAGSLGINLVGANRVIVFDASWNPCHDTQAVCRVYRYGQKKPCYVYRFVMDCCLEKKIYDRQINKQGMADRVVDELNPDAHLSIKEVTNLCWDDQEQTSVEDYSHLKDKYHDDIIKILIDKHSPQLSKAPFQHESLLVDRKEKKLSQAEKRLAKRSYELEKQASTNPKSLFQLFPNNSVRGFQKPIASVRPMQFGGSPARSKWIPAEVWQKQGMTAQEMTLPVDVVIPTNAPDKTSIVLKAGERVMVLKSPKGIYMQLQTGKIIAIRTAFKVGGAQQSAEKPNEGKASQIATALKNNPNVTITHKTTQGPRIVKATTIKQSSLDKQAAAVNMAATKGRVALINKAKTALARPNLKLPAKKDEPKPADSVKSDIDTKHTVESELMKNLMVDAGKKVQDSGGEVKVTTGFAVPSSTLPQISMDLPEPPALTGEQQTAVPPEAQDLWDQPQKESAVIAQPAPAPPKEEDVKKEEDPARAWQGGYPNPMDPYGNYYPGYYGYGHMPSYDGYPYHQPYPPHLPAVKQEAGVEGAAPPPAPHPPAPHPFPPYPPRGYPPAKPDAPDTAPPVPAAPHPYPAYPPRPFPPAHHPAKPLLKPDGADVSHSTPPPAPMYAPYPAPYPYPYNYPPYPPQAQPPTPTPAVKPEPTETAPYTPPYGPRPPYPTAPAPPFYPNYPPYRPYHDPNYPYPNYNPYMPPGYGYPPMQHQVQHPQHGVDGSAVAQPSAATGEHPNN